MTKKVYNDYCTNVIGKENLIYQKIDGMIKPRPPDYYIQIPCGTCFYCLKRKRQEWSLRLMYEILDHKQSTFLTLTFTDEYLDKFKDDYKKPLKLYIDRLRKKIGFRPRYFFISEYGDEHDRFHFHGIIFGTNQETLSYSVQNSLWHYGRSSTGYVNFKTANYLTKYMLKMQNGKKPLLMCSNGIGQRFFRQSNQTLKYFNNGDGRFIVSVFNNIFPLPTYYKNKIFDDDLKLELMLTRANSLPTNVKFKGVEYNPHSKRYLQAVRSYYQDTLKRNSSLIVVKLPEVPITPNKEFFNFNFITDGTIHFPET